jgi:hypothetical protein
MNPSMTTPLRHAKSLASLLTLLYLCLVMQPLHADPASPFPTFPQAFTLAGPGSASFPLAVTQPGPINIDVKSSGSPIIVTLRRRLGTPLQQQGSGEVQLTYGVTPADVKQGSLWVVNVRLLPPGPSALSPAARGMITVQQPPADVAAAVSEATALARIQPARSAPSAEDGAQFESRRAALQLQLDQQAQQRRAQQRALTQPLLDQIRRAATLQTQTSQAAAIATRGLPQASSKASQATPGVVQRSYVAPMPVAAAPPPPAPAPIITGLFSVPNVALNQASPLDQIIITGQHFGTVAANVIFQLSPTQTFSVSPGSGFWSDTLIVVNVPDVSGLVRASAGLWVQLTPAASNVAPFLFVPALEYRHTRATADAMGPPGTDFSTDTGPTYSVTKVTHPNRSFASLGGDSGNDFFFMQAAPLLNGWAPQSIDVKLEGTADPFAALSANAYVADSAINASPPGVRFNVRWYFDAFAFVHYEFDVLIVGPRGTPDGLVKQ